MAAPVSIRIMSAGGKVIFRLEVPDAGLVFEPTFTAEETSQLVRMLQLARAAAEAWTLEDAKLAAQLLAAAPAQGKN